MIYINISDRYDRLSLLDDINDILRRRRYIFVAKMNGFAKNDDISDISDISERFDRL